MRREIGINANTARKMAKTKGIINKHTLCGIPSFISLTL